MKRFLKNLIFLCMIIVLTFSDSIIAYESNNEFIEFEIVAREELEIDSNFGLIEADSNSDLLAEIGEKSIKYALKVDDMTLPLYVTFDFPEKAIKNISTNKCVQAIKNVEGLEDINNNNWSEYYDGMYRLLELDECPEWLVA